MNDETVRKGFEGPDVSAADRAGAPDPATGEAPAVPSEPPLELQVADLKDRLLRTLAEMENLRRRTDKEVTDARVYAVTAFARDLLSVSDSMRRGLDAIGPDLRDSADAGIKALIEGIELTERELQKVLAKHGIAKLEPQGQKFDPNFHQAMFELPDPSVPSGTVVQVVQAGYVIADRVLRPALVGVAKGGPKPTADRPASNASDAGAPQETAAKT